MKNIINILKQIYFYLERKEKIVFFYIIFLMVISSIAEIFSIGILIPFVTILFSPELIKKIYFYYDILLFLKIEENYFVTFFFITFLSSIIISGLFRIYVVYFIYRFPKEIAIKFSEKIFTSLIYKNYNEIIRINSGYMFSAITDKMNLLSGLITAALNLIASSVVCLGIFLMLLLVDALSSVILLTFISLFYLIILLFVKKKLSQVSIILSKFSFLKIKIVKESLGGIKRIILDNSQKIFIKQFTKLERNFRLSEAKVLFLSVFPRFLLEIFGIIILATFAYIYITNFNDLKIELLTFISVLVFSAQRLMPHANIIYNSIVSATSNSESVDEILKLLNKNSIEKIKENESLHSKKSNLSLAFNNTIHVNDITFQYNKNRTKVFNNFSTKILKKDKVVIIGESGSGKSTLIDIILGLLKPTKGSILIDGIEMNEETVHDWRKKCSLVPQEIYLFDDTIGKNITFKFSEEKLDMEKIIQSTISADIHDFIKQLPNGYETMVGENGVFLSGGQKQRIGIARALYQDREVILLDEVTSALDVETESVIINNIKQLYKDKTIILITHREKNISFFDKVIKLN